MRTVPLSALAGTVTLMLVVFVTFFWNPGLPPGGQLAPSLAPASSDAGTVGTLALRTFYAGLLNGGIYGLIAFLLSFILASLGELRRSDRGDPRERAR